MVIAQDIRQMEKSNQRHGSRHNVLVQTIANGKITVFRVHEQLKRDVIDAWVDAIKARIDASKPGDEVRILHDLRKSNAFMSPYAIGRFEEMVSAFPADRTYRMAMLLPKSLGGQFMSMMLSYNHLRGDAGEMIFRDYEAALRWLLRRPTA